MARTLNKLDRMGLSESALGEETLEEVKDNLAEAMASLETFEEQREAAAESFAEAASYHEERDWESRDDSLNTAAEAVEEMSGALDEIEGQSEFVTLPDGRMETMRKMIEDVREHLGALI
jgi:acyl-CoA reductase-like NAD-dependent aldehyde dehydrogenase